MEAVEWTVDYTDLLAPSLLEMRRTFPDIDEKLKKFIDLKLTNPLAARYGKHDGPFTGPLAGFYHAHLRDDAIIIYKLKNRAIIIVMLVRHAEIEGRRAKSIRNLLSPHL